MSKDKINAIIAITTTPFTILFGSLTLSMKILFIMMVIDYATGLMTGYFNKSLKTESGGLNSKVGFKGLAKKMAIIIYVIISHQMDCLLNIEYCQNLTCLFFISNEILSIAENTSLLGVELPTPIQKCLDVLNKKEE